MNQGKLAKLAATRAEEICQHYKLSKKAKKLFRAEFTVPQFLETLMQAGQFVDVFDLLAHVISSREAVWWACLGVRHAQGPALPPLELTALKAAVQWVLESDEPRRRAAESAGNAAGFSTPAGGAAFAVFVSSGSLSPANLPEVPVEPFMAAKAVAGSLAMASVQGDATTIPDVQRELVELGLAIAEGRISCPTPAKTAAEPSAMPGSSPRRF